MNPSNFSEKIQPEPKKRLARITRRQSKNEDDLDLEDDEEDNEAYSGVSSNDKESPNLSSNDK